MAVGSRGIQIGQPLTDTGAIILDDQIADLIAQTEARWIRLHFRLGPFPTVGQDFFAIYDQIVDRLLVRGLQIIGLVSYETCAGGQEDWLQNSSERTQGDGYNIHGQYDGHGWPRDHMRRWRPGGRAPGPAGCRGRPRHDLAIAPRVQRARQLPCRSSAGDATEITEVDRSRCCRSQVTSGTSRSTASET